MALTEQATKKVLQVSSVSTFEASSKVSFGTMRRGHEGEAAT